MLGRPFHHIGIACANLDAAAAHVHRAYEVVSDTGTIYDPEQNAHVRLFNAGTPGAIELVSGPVVAKLVAHKTSYYHVCYSTPDLEGTLALAAARGAIRISGPTAAVLFGGRRVAFVYTPLGLVEFLEDA